MTLKEIEARAQKGWLVKSHDALGGPAVWRDDLQAERDVDLLARGVRQLGAIVRERESEIITANRVEAGSLDPDVLNLIAPNDSEPTK